MRETLIVNLMLVTLAALWGSSFMFIKVALETLTPLSIAAGRIGLGALFLVLIVKLRGLTLPTLGRHWKFIAIAGIVGNVLPFSFISYGERFIDSSLASMLMSTVPFFTILLAHVFTVDEKLSLDKMIGLIIGFGGIIMLFGPTALLGLGKEVLAQLFIVCAALCYATSSIVTRHLSHLPKLQIAAAILLVGSMVIVPMTVIIERPWQLTPSSAGLESVFMLGVIQTAAAHLLLLRIIELRGASFLSLNNYILPLFGVLWGMLFLAEGPTSSAIIALPIVLLGLFICQGGLQMRRKLITNKH